MGSRPNLDIELGISIGVSETFPVDLREEISEYVKVKGNTALNDGVVAIIARYAEEHGYEYSRNSTHKHSETHIVNGKEIKTKAEEVVYKDGKILQKPEGVSSFLEKVKARRAKQQEESLENQLDKITEEMQNAVGEIGPNSSDADKSKAAYIILDGKIRAAIIKFKKTQQIGDDEDNINEKLEQIEEAYKADPDALSSHKAHLLQVAKKSIGIVQTIGREAVKALRQLGVVSLEEYLELNSEDQLNYLKFTVAELERIEEEGDKKVSEEFKRAKNETKQNLNFGEHLSTVLTGENTKIMFG